MLPVIGCGKKGAELGEVQGIVTVNGVPLSSGNVVSYPESGRGAVGEIQSDGTFELATRELGKGAVAGKHRLAIVAYGTVGGATGPEADAAPLVALHYMQPDTSGLSVDVSADQPKYLKLDLKAMP
ncbi:MAG: hypothetical protein WD468_08355 [Pirellulales bacterium]